jgi:N6-adenosine-specific RNA methylase IME4
MSRMARGLEAPSRNLRVRYSSSSTDAFLDIVEQVSPGPYLEMFARRARFGWEYYGDESLGTAELPRKAA